MCVLIEMVVVQGHTIKPNRCTTLKPLAAPLDRDRLFLLPLLLLLQPVCTLFLHTGPLISKLA